MPFNQKYIVAFLFSVLLSSSCSKRNYNVDAETMGEQPEQSGFSLFRKKGTEPSALADTAKPKLALNQDTTLYDDPAKKKKKFKKKSKKEFLGYEIKRGIAKTRSGKNATVEIYNYVTDFVEPNPYAPAKYVYSTRSKKIVKVSTADPKTSRILHGPYKKTVGKNVVSEGFFYMGTRHLRWETYRFNTTTKENFLLTKTHYEKGFPRDAIINYYDAAKTKIKEVIPYSEGKLEGDYVMFFESGLRAWEGQYEAGKKIGVWIEYWPFRNRKHYEYQYPETADADPFEPFLLREFNRNFSLVYEKGKLDKRTAQ